jgi:hypothetical protein
MRPGLVVRRALRVGYRKNITGMPLIRLAAANANRPKTESRIPAVCSHRDSLSMEVGTNS